MKHRTGHLFKRGSNFYVFWRVNGKAFSKALRDKNGLPITIKREAEEARAKLMAPFTVADEAAALESIAGKLEGRKAELARLEDKQNPPLKVGQAWQEFLASPSRPDTGPQTLVVYEYQFNKFAEWLNANHPERAALRDVNTEIAEQYAAKLNHGTLTANTYNKHLNVLTMVFRVLKHKARLTANPWEEIPRKRIVAQGRRELTVDELRKVCRGAEGELRTLLALGIYTGLRQGDCATLRWGEVDLPRSIIRRIPNKMARRNPKPVIIPIHPVLRDMLGETPVDQRQEYVLPQSADSYLNHRRNLVMTIQDHFSKCGIRVHKPGTVKDRQQPIVEVGFHSLRHTFVSMCRESNAPLAVVESIVGHSNPAMTRHYTHVGELAASRAVALLPAVIGDAQADNRSADTDPKNILLQVRRIAKNITAANWKAKKASLLALVEVADEDGAKL
jgi:integrase